MIRPLLAVGIETEEQLAGILKKFGELMVSEKKDGIRAISSGVLMSREGKPIPNRQIQNIFKFIPSGIEGELMFIIDGVGNSHPPLEHINSVVTSEDCLWPRRWSPRFYAFDWQSELSSDGFYRRYKYLLNTQEELNNPLFKVIKQHRMDNMQKLLGFFQYIINKGGEGICLRNPNGKYKQGRSTLNDGCLMRFKKLIYDVATIVDMTFVQRHIGPKKINAFGLAKRDNKFVNLQDTRECGALIGHHESFGSVKVGSGFTAKQRIEFFDNQNELKGQKFEFAYRDTTYKGVPRNPTFVSLVV